MCGPVPLLSYMILSFLSLSAFIPTPNWIFLSLSVMVLLSSTNAFSLHGVPFAHPSCVVDNKGSLLAEDFLVKLSNTYAYAVFCPQAALIENKTICVKKEEEGRGLRLESIEEERPDRRLLPVYIQAHFNPKERYADCHLLDDLVDKCMGRHNLDLKKNITADFFEVTDQARDEAGFIVSDKLQFVYQTFNPSQLASQLTPSLTVKVTPFTSANLDELIDFDHSVSGFNREVYVEEMAKKTNTLIGREDGRIVAVLHGGEGRVYALYAESKGAAHAVLKSFISKQSKKISLYSPRGTWSECLSSSVVHRRHTRVIPSLINWSFVYSHNAGMNIV